MVGGAGIPHIHEVVDLLHEMHREKSSLDPDLWHKCPVPFPKTTMFLMYNKQTG
jgi:hypothetical protein